MSSNSLTNHDVGRPPRLRVFLSEWRGATYGPDEEICCRDDRHVLAYVRGLRFGRHRRRVPASRDRIAGGLAGLRPHRSHDGVFHRPHLRMSPQSRRDHRPDSRWPLPIKPSCSLRHRPGGRGRDRGRGALCHRQWRARLRSGERVRGQRLWRTLAGQIWPCLGLCGGVWGHRHVLVRHHGLDPRQGTSGLCPARHWFCADPHSSRFDPGHEHLGEPGAQYGSGPLRGGMGAGATLAVLGRPDPGRGSRRDPVSLAQRGTFGPGDRNGNRDPSFGPGPRLRRSEGCEMRLSVGLYHLSGEGSSMDRRTFVLGFLSALAAAPTIVAAASSVEAAPVPAELPPTPQLVPEPVSSSGEAEVDLEKVESDWSQYRYRHRRRVYRRAYRRGARRVYRRAYRRGYYPRTYRRRARRVYRRAYRRRYYY